jgi:hypothetical protein
MDGDGFTCYPKDEIVQKETLTEYILTRYEQPVTKPYSDFG